MSQLVTAIFMPKEEAREQLLIALREFIPRVHAEDGCELFALYENPDGSVALIEKWESVEHLDAHNEGPAVADFRPKLAGLLDRAPSVTRLVSVPLGEPSKGVV